MKLEFFRNLIPLFGQYQKDLSVELCSRLASGIDFIIELKDAKNSKSYEQIKGLHRICALFALRLPENEGRRVSNDTAKEILKYRFNYVELASYDECFKEANKIKREKALLGDKMTLKEFDFLVKKLMKTFYVPKSFAEGSFEEISILIKEIHQTFVIGMNWQEIELLPEELRKINEYFNNKKE